MIEAVRSWLIKFLAKLLPPIFRWIFSHEKLVSLIEVTINSENEGLVINCAELPDARVWVEITNLSPLKLKLVGVEAILYWVGRTAEFKSLQRVELAPHSKKRILVETALSGRQVTHIQTHHGSGNPRLNINLYLESSIRSIHKQRDIQTSNIKLLNCKN